MVQNQPEDFDDLGQPISFTFKEKVYNVPIPTPKKSKELLKMGRNIQRKSKELEKKLKEYEDKGEEPPEELMEESEQIFDFQIKFILTAGINEVDKENGEILKDVIVSKEFMEENWTNKLVQRVFRRVNESFAENDQEKKA